MSRVQPVSQENLPPTVQAMFNELEKKIGRVPNVFRTMGNSPTTLKAFITLSSLADQTSFSKPFQEKIALAVSEANQCQYCLSAHSLIAKTLGVIDNDITGARKATSSNPKEQAILRFAKSVVEKRGKISDQEVNDLKAQGVSDKEIAELLLIITINFFTNYFNNVTNPEIDFPLAPKLS